MATHSSILAWRMSWTEEPGGLQSLRSQRLRQDRATNTHSYVTDGRCKRMVGGSPQVARRAGLAWMPSLLGAQEFCTLWGCDLGSPGANETRGPPHPKVAGRCGPAAPSLGWRRRRPVVASTRRRFIPSGALSAGCGGGPATPPCHLAADEREGCRPHATPRSFLWLLVSRLDRNKRDCITESSVC